MGVWSAAECGLAVVVLAAGRGTRLAEGGEPGRPKWLLPVAGRPVADYQLDGLAAAAGPDDRLLVVTGYGAESIVGWLRIRGAPLPVDVVPNPAWAELNNWYSLLAALRRLERIGWPGGLVILNSDLCAPPAWYAAFLAAVRRAPAGEAVLAVDEDRLLTDEAMKVGAGARTAGTVTYCSRIGKVGVPDPIGEYVGMAAFAPGDWRRLVPALERFVGASQHAAEWYEAAFQQLMDDRMPFRVHPAAGDWVEIDDRADWRRANLVMAAR